MTSVRGQGDRKVVSGRNRALLVAGLALAIAFGGALERPWWPWGAVLLAPLGLCLGALALERWLVRPLRELALAAERLAREDLDTPVALPMPGRTLGRLALALEQVRVRLAERRTLLAENRYNAYLAQHDGLTGLPNRMEFARQIDAAIAAAQADGSRVAAVMIDIDRFKHINDRYGHEVGDAVLRGAARAAQACLRMGEGIARFGGDEFAAFKLLRTDEELAEFLDRLEVALCTPVVRHGATLRPAVSIGISLWPDDSQLREHLINNADLAMYRAKAGRAKKRLRYDPEMDERARRRAALVDELAGAGVRGELAVFYQPQHSASGVLLGFEALMRWTHPQLGAISPAEFIPLAEESGLILDLGDWVLGEACAAAMQLPPGLAMAVNVSALQLGDPALAQRIHQALLRTGLAPSRLEIEITETALATNRARALHVLRQVRALGVRIAIDDFGVGYSSLDTVSTYPIDKIKIDRCFIADIAHHAPSRTLVTAAVSIGESLGVTVLAEGVETEAQRDLVCELGCGAMQGFLFGQPQPLAIVLALSQAGALGARRRGAG